VPLNLPDKTRVKVTVDLEMENPSSLRENAGGGDFDSDLDGLLFSGPTLPPDFSRADIYADHD